MRGSLLPTSASEIAAAEVACGVPIIEGMLVVPEQQEEEHPAPAVRQGAEVELATTCDSVDDASAVSTAAEGTNEAAVIIAGTRVHRDRTPAPQGAHSHQQDPGEQCRGDLSSSCGAEGDEASTTAALLPTASVAAAARILPRRACAETAHVVDDAPLAEAGEVDHEMADEDL